MSWNDGKGPSTKFKVTLSIKRVMPDSYNKENKNERFSDIKPRITQSF